MSVRWSDEAHEAVARAIYLRLNGGQWASGLTEQAGGTPWGTSWEADRHEEYLNHADVVLNALRPELEAMLTSAEEDAVANVDWSEVYCQEPHVDTEWLDNLRADIRDHHIINHLGPLDLCREPICDSLTEATP